MTSNQVDETQFRHPLEHPVFIASVVFNLTLMTAAIIAANLGAEWLSTHPFVHRHIQKIRLLAIAAVLSPPVVVFVRNTRRASILGNSVRLSPEQLPLIYGLLEEHCRKLGNVPVPELYLTDKAVPAPSLAFSTWNHDCIALSSRFIERKPEKSRDVLSFMLARELGRIRLGHTKVWYDALLAYMSKVPYARNPLTQVQTLSHDRYGAYLEPNALPGLLILASGRRLIAQIGVEAYLQRALEYRGFWAMLSDLTRQQPHISYRVRALRKQGLLEIQPVALEAQNAEDKDKKKKKKDKHKDKKVDTEPSERLESRATVVRLDDTRGTGSAELQVERSEYDKAG